MHQVHPELTLRPESLHSPGPETPLPASENPVERGRSYVLPQQKPYPIITSVHVGSRPRPKTTDVIGPQFPYELDLIYTQPRGETRAVAYLGRAPHITIVHQTLNALAHDTGRNGSLYLAAHPAAYAPP